VRRIGRLLACVAALGAIGACSTSHQDVLPWFRIETTRYWQPMGFGGGSSQQRFYVRRWLVLWHELKDAMGVVAALDERTVLYGSRNGPRLIREGETTPELACPGEGAGGPTRRAMHPAVSIVPPGHRYDCFEVVDGPAVAVATRIRVRRYDADRRLAFDSTVEVDAPGRVFARAMVSFYDGAGAAYFVALDDDPKRRGCTLIALDAGGPRVAGARDDIPRGACSDAPSWTRYARLTPAR
jgi:hypothetical protein